MEKVQHTAIGVDISKDHFDAHRLTIAKCNNSESNDFAIGFPGRIVRRKNRPHPEVLEGHTFCSMLYCTGLLCPLECKSALADGGLLAFRRGRARPC